MDNRQDKIKYLCKRYNINAALAAETLAALDHRKRLTIDQLAKLCDENKSAYWQKNIAFALSLRTI